MDRIRSFLYRFPRFTVACRMDFILDEAVILGTCFDLSQSGLCGTFAEEISAGSKGLLTLYLEECPFEVHATVSSVREGETRMRFQFASDKERNAMRELLDRIAPQPGK
jgi:hypothetical protein